MELAIHTAVMIGLLGSTHCVGMCGGIVGALNVGLPHSGRPPLSRGLHHLTYNAGRIVSYAAAGALAGLAGALMASNISLDTAVPVGRLIAGLFMIALGLYVAGWWHAVAAMERAGAHLWKRIEPLGGRFLPATTPARTFGLGLVWGWLPCGLVYSALVLAMVSASPGKGAMIMLGFGLGTLPMLLVIGGAAEHLIKLMRHPVLRQVVGATIMLFGVYACVTAVNGHAHSTPGSGSHTTRQDHSGDGGPIGRQRGVDGSGQLRQRSFSTVPISPGVGSTAAPAASSAAFFA